MAEELIYQSSHEGQEIDDAVDNLGTPQDTSDKDTAFGRIEKLRQDVGEATDSPDSAGSAFARIKELQDNGSIKDLLTQAGATANADGTYTLFGVKQTLEETLSAYAHIPSGQDFSYAYITLSNLTFKVNFRPNVWYNPTITSMRMICYNNAEIELCHLPGSSAVDNGAVVLSGSMNQAFWGCTALKHISCSFIDVQDCSSFQDAFIGCAALQVIRLRKLNKSVSFADSPNLNKDSILYMVQNSAATSAITITLHPTAYAMAIADNDIQTALQEKTFVSLAQAEMTE